MRIGISLGMTSPSDGGGHTFYDKLVKDFLKVRTRHSIVVFYTDPSWEKLFASSSIELVKIPELKSNLISRQFKKVRTVLEKASPRFFPPAQPVFETVIAENPVDIMVCMPGSQMSRKIPYILILWDNGHLEHPYFPELLDEFDGREFFHARYLRSAYKIIIGNQAGKDELLRFYQVDPARISVVPFAIPAFVDSTRQANWPDISSKYDIKHPLLFYPAQFWAHKNHITLINAVKLLKEKHNLLFDVILTGSDKGNRSHIEQHIVESGLSAQFHLPGFVTPDELNGIYANSFAMTYMSCIGPDNLPPLEAMMMGCPVICARYPGAEEQLRDGALFFDMFDEKLLADNIMDLYSKDGLRNELIAKGFSVAKERDFNYAERLLGEIEPFGKIRSLWTGAEQLIKQDKQVN